MQELALLLLLPEHRTDMPTRLLSELSACQSESEAIEVLFIFWLAFNQGWAPRPDLGATVLRKSMLTDRLLAYMGLASPASLVPPLAAAPTDFHAPIDFECRQDRDAPRVC